MLKEGGNLLTSATMVAQARNRAGAVNFMQAVWNGLHRHDLNFTSHRRDAGNFTFPSFTHIEHQRLGLLAGLFGPFVKLCGADMLHAAEVAMVLKNN